MGKNWSHNFGLAFFSMAQQETDFGSMEHKSCFAMENSLFFIQMETAWIRTTIATGIKCWNNCWIVNCTRLKADFSVILHDLKTLTQNPVK